MGRRTQGDEEMFKGADMNYRDLFVGIMAVAIMLVAVVPVAGQTGATESTGWTVPRTPDGHPDLQGVWSNNSATPLERPDALSDKPELTQEEVADLASRARELFNGATDAAFGDSVFEAVLADQQGYTSSDTGTGNYNQFWLVDREFENRTSLVVDPVDGRVPELTADGAERTSERRARRENHPADSYTDRSNSDRCITYGVPRIRAGYNSYFQFVQTADHVAIVKELIHDVRVIPLDGRPHLEDSLRQWMGDSRAHWEDDTLVVKTTNYSEKSNFMGSSEKFQLVERFTRVGPETLNWQLTFTDPSQWTQPWTVLISLRKSEDAVFEFACHEGNIAMEGILAGHRSQERAEAEQ
jgi:hypothetical protein